MSAQRPDILPYTVPLDEQALEVEGLPDPDIFIDPEMLLSTADHSGVSTALAILPPRQRQILCEKIGLNALGAPRSSAEIADELSLSVETVSSALTRARNKLRAVGNICDVINGEFFLVRESEDNPLQTS